MLETLKVALSLILYVAVISLPGMGIAFLGWWLSRTMRPVSVQTVFRAGLLATAVTPSFYGHAGPVPAIILVFILQGRERLAGIVPILVVWLIAIAVISARAKSERFRMGYLDEACAWLIFLGGLVHVVLTDFLHFRGSLDTALVWIFAAMLNLLRINNDSSVRWLRIFCVAANVSVLMLEAVRWKMFEGTSSLVLLALIFIESVFSIIPKTPRTNLPVTEVIA
jgi:hypothetical protein